MNILSRLKRLQSTVVCNSEFCGCQKQVAFRIIETPEDDVEHSTIICEACHKPHREPIVATFNIKTNGATQ